MVAGDYNDRLMEEYKDANFDQYAPPTELVEAAKREKHCLAYANELAGWEW
jgi:hypothetical protein